MNFIAGDIINFDYSDRYQKSWYMKLIRKMLVFFDGKVSHSAIYLGNNEMLEAWDGVGVRVKKINLKAHNIEILRPKNSSNIKEKDIILQLIIFKNQNLGKKYSFRDWANVGLGKLSKKLWNKTENVFKNDKKGFICSELVREFWKQKFNIDITPGKMTPSPNDVSNSKELTKIKLFNEVL